MFGHVLHHERIAQIRLVGAIFAHRFGIGNARPACVTGLPSPNSSNTPREDRLDGGEDVVLGDKAHFDVELIEFAGLRSARASSSRKQGAIWK